MGIGIVSPWMRRTKIEVAPNARLKVCEAMPPLSHTSSRRDAELKIYAFLGGIRIRWSCGRAIYSTSFSGLSINNSMEYSPSSTTNSSSASRGIPQRV
jgi:hypothetical protein